MIELITQLDTPSPSGLADLGGAWDAGIFNACRAFSESDETAKAVVRGMINEVRSWVVIGWADGMASLAVRESSSERLVYGLVGLSLFNSTEIDEREALVVIPLFVRASRIIGCDADSVIRAAAGKTDAVGSKWLMRFIPSNQRDSLMIHEERGSGQEFAFVRKGVQWDPLTELADILDENREP